MKFAVNWFHNVNLALYSNRIMPDRCLVRGCSNRSDMNAGISAHFSPTIKSERDMWLRFVHTHRANLRTFARKFSNIDFFLKILPLKDDELVMSEK